MASMDIEAAIAAQVQQSPPESITELILDACKATKVTGLDKFINLEMLTLNGCGLTSLEGFPTLPNLKTLELSDNQLADGCLEELQNAALLNLNRLSLAGNRFSTLEALEPLVRACAPRACAPACRTPALSRASAQRPRLSPRASRARSRVCARTSRTFSQLLHTERDRGALYGRLPACDARARFAFAPTPPDMRVRAACAELMRRPARPGPLQLLGYGNRELP